MKPEPNRDRMRASIYHPSRRRFIVSRFLDISHPEPSLPKPCFITVASSIFRFPNLVLSIPAALHYHTCRLGLSPLLPRAITTEAPSHHHRGLDIPPPTPRVITSEDSMYHSVTSIYHSKGFDIQHSPKPRLSHPDTSILSPPRPRCISPEAWAIIPKC